MPWVPIHESGIEFTFASTDAVTMEGSTITGVPGNEDQGWTIAMSLPERRARVTVQSLSISGAPYEGFFRFVNILTDPTGKFVYPALSPPSVDPNPVDSEDYLCTGLEYHATVVNDGPEGGSVETYEMLVEVFVEDDELIANDDEATTQMDQPVTIDILANDTLGGQPVSLADLDELPTIVADPSVGEASIGADGRATYNPPAGFSGEVEFQYRISTPDPDPPNHLDMCGFMAESGIILFHHPALSRDHDIVITSLYDEDRTAVFEPYPPAGQTWTYPIWQPKPGEDNILEQGEFYLDQNGTQYVIHISEGASLTLQGGWWMWEGTDYQSPFDYNDPFQILLDGETYDAVYNESEYSLQITPDPGFEPGVTNLATISQGTKSFCAIIYLPAD